MWRKLAIVFFFTTFLFSSCTTTVPKDSYTLDKKVSISSYISSIDNYGNVTLNTFSKDFLDKGFSVGDEVLIETDTGLITTAKIYSQYFEKEDTTIITTGMNSQLITISLSLGNFAKKGNLELGNNVTITLINLNS